MGLFSSRKNNQQQTIKKDPLTPKEEMSNLLETWDYEKTPSTLTDINKIMKFYDIVSKDPTLYKYLPNLLHGSSIGATEKYYKYLQKKMDMSDFLYKVKCAAKEPGVHEDKDVEKVYMNLYKDMFGFRRSKNDLEAYNEVDHIQKSKDVIEQSVKKIEDTKNNPFVQSSDVVYQETEKIADEVMKYPTLIEDVPDNVLEEHKGTLINNFYDIIASKYKSEIDFVKDSLKEDRANGISISKDNLAYEKISKGLDEYFSYVEKTSQEITHGDFYESTTEEEFDKQLEYYEKNISPNEFYNPRDLDKDETFLGKADPMLEETFYNENMNEMSAFYEQEYGLVSKNIEEMQMQEKTQSDKGQEVDLNAFDYDEYLNEENDYMPSTDGFLENDEEKDSLYSEYSIKANDERNYIETIERAGLIEVEFNNLVEKLGSRDLGVLSENETEEIQNKLAQIIAREPDLYIDLPYDLSNPYNKENDEFYLNLKEQVKEQGNEISEEITRDLKSFNTKTDKEDRPIINNDIEKDEIVEER